MSLPVFLALSLLSATVVASGFVLASRRSRNPVSQDPSCGWASLDPHELHEAKISCYGPGSRVAVRKALDAMGIGPGRRSYTGATKESLPAWYVEVTISEWMEILGWSIPGTERVEIDLSLVTAVRWMDGRI